MTLGAENRFRILIERHCETLQSSVAAAGTCLAEYWQDPAAAAEAAQRVADITHSIAGAGGTIGFHEVTRRARALEDAFRPLAQGEPPSGAVRDRIAALFGDLERVVAGIRPEDSTLYHLDLTEPEVAAARQARAR